MGFIWRILAYAWPLPYTLFGVSIGLLLGGRFRRVEGVIEVHGPRVAEVLCRFLVPAMAITIGHVVLGRNSEALEVTREHERVHVRQYERWGVFFIPAYVLMSGLLYARGRDGYRENPFEIEAFAVDEVRAKR